MSFIKNEQLLTKLILEGYKIPLNQIQQIDFVFTKVGIKTVDDYNGLLNYLKGYSERSAKTLDFWDMKDSTQQYYLYVKCMEKASVIKRFPREDLYYIVEAMEELRKENYEDWLAKKALEKAKEQYGNSWCWGGCDTK